MMRLGWVITAVALLGACTPPVPRNGDDTVHPRQEPSNYEPGIHVSGYVNVGVSKGF